MTADEKIRALEERVSHLERVVVALASGALDPASSVDPLEDRHRTVVAPRAREYVESMEAQD